MVPATPLWREALIACVLMKQVTLAKMGSLIEKKGENICASEHPVKGYLKILEGFQVYLLFCQQTVAARLSRMERQNTEGVQTQPRDVKCFYCYLI